MSSIYIPVTETSERRRCIEHGRPGSDSSNSDGAALKMARQSLSCAAQRLPQEFESPQHYWAMIFIAVNAVT